MSNLLFSFQGRVGRKVYWMLMLGTIIGAILTTLIDITLTGKENGIATAIFSLLLLWPALAIQVKRWHDRNKSGWWVLINLIPLIGPLWALVENGFLRGSDTANRFGDSPARS